jgi:hypothetical protein
VTLGTLVAVTLVLVVYVLIWVAVWTLLYAEGDREN